MPLYRASPKDGVAWVTGASSGIGRALSLELARRGYTVAATARTEDKLNSLADEAKGLPGRVVPFPCDVTEETAMAALVKRIEAEVGPIALAVFNAGNYLPAKGERLDIANFRTSFEINVFGVINGLVPLVEQMRARGSGQIAIVASVTAYFGWPTAAAYGATKAALNNMAEALKYDLDKLDIRVQIINPGFVATPLTGKNDFRMPGVMPVDRAVRRLADALETGGFETTFPHRFTWPVKLLRILPQPLRFWFINRATGWNKRPVSGTRRN